MERPCNELLARSVLTRDENARWRGCDLLYLLHKRPHHRRLADDLERCIDRFSETGVLFLEVEVGERIPQHHQDAIGVEGLLQYLVGAELRCLDGGANGGVAA